MDLVVLLCLSKLGVTKLFRLSAHDRMAGILGWDCVLEQRRLEQCLVAWLLLKHCTSCSMLVWPGSLEKKAKRTTLYGQQVPAQYDPWLSVPKTRSVIPKDSGAMVKKPQCEIYRKCLSNDSVFSTSFYLNLESATVHCYEYQPLGHSFSSSS